MSSDEWRTPDGLFRVMDGRYGYTIDVAADFHNAKCPVFITARMNALETPWGVEGYEPGFFWCNPPYSNIPGFLRRGIEMIEAGWVRGGTFLIRADVSTRYWHELVVPHAAEILWPNGRVNYLTAHGDIDRGSGTSGARSPNFASALVTYHRKVDGIDVPLVYGTISYDRGKQYGRGELDRLPGETAYRRRAA